MSKFFLFLIVVLVLSGLGFGVVALLNNPNFLRLGIMSYLFFGLLVIATCWIVYELVWGEK